MVHLMVRGIGFDANQETFIEKIARSLFYAMISSLLCVRSAGPVDLVRVL